MTAWEELQQWLMKNVGGKEAEQCNDIVRRIVDETLASIRIEVSGEQAMDDAEQWNRLKPERIVLSQEDHDAFVRQLESPPKPNAKLIELLRRKPVWER